MHWWQQGETLNVVSAWHISTALARTVPILTTLLLCPMHRTQNEVQLVIWMKEPDKIREACRKRFVLGFAMHSYDRINPALKVYLLVTSYKWWVREIMCPLPWFCRSAVTVAPAFNPGPNRWITIYIKLTIISQQLIAYNTPGAKPWSIQLVPIKWYMLHKGIQQTVAWL